MLKKRIVFVLLWKDGKFCLSRNFKLQNAGDLRWIEQNYNFRIISRSIDELIVLNVSRNGKNATVFAEQIAELTRGCFMPLAAGGGITNIEDGMALLRAGADKLVVNTALHRKPDLVRSLATQFGRQCVVGSIDYRNIRNSTETFIENGSVATGQTVEDTVRIAEALGVGELFLTSIERDGTGQGYDLATLRRASEIASMPVIASGGVGKFEHLAEWLVLEVASAAATANIFNFLGNGLPEARAHLTKEHIALAAWDFAPIDRDRNDAGMSS